MALYYYNKYYVNANNAWRLDPFVFYRSNSGYASNYAYTDYTFNSSDGTVDYTGWTRMAGLFEDRKPAYGNYHSHIRKFVGTQETKDAWYWDEYTADIVSYTYYTRGGLIESNIIAENGTYPNNGRSGSYWYVRGSLVTPGTPTSITVPEEIKGGATITVSWGTSTNSDSFRLERQFNGGSWSEVYNGTLMTRTDTIPKGTTSVAYRVRGANGTAYSSYRASSTVTVKNFPEMGIRVSGVLKTSDAGWVRVSGQLREIDTIWVRINGALKEVQ